MPTHNLNACLLPIVLIIAFHNGIPMILLKFTKAAFYTTLIGMTLYESIFPKKDVHAFLGVGAEMSISKTSTPKNVYRAKMSTVPKCLLAGASPEGTFGQEIYNFQWTFGEHLRTPCSFAYNLSRMNANPLLKSCIPHKYFVYLFSSTGSVLFLPLSTCTITFV